MANQLSDKVSYIRGLMEGMKFDTDSNEGRLLDKIIELLGDMADEIEAVSDAQAGDFDGYWKSQFIAVGEGTVFASAVGDKTDVYIEGTSVALGGPLFGDVLVGMELRDGTLYYEAGSVSVTLTLQRDGFLRLTLGGENSVTLYLFPAVPKALPEG